ncbi:hypothetical protein [Ulvibacter litoralis]|uniref:Copper chaperone CopZ n=1 Tax=Ulvibacter litoralis TaxID=227084 RepID=A0A1G7HPC6_9FLAO|nr:hypothetical protein [Ulvibacter litoralis]GHC58571.1 hypothetical protein GCM10008083_24220 [Ulvibacter litoralis]SDF02293.1 hypothetical protein SAMN05421855_104213 [Ulvibacter litoralis]
MNTVLVFKTSVVKQKDIIFLSPLLNTVLHSTDCWNFDLEDCDNILRVETQSLPANKIVSILLDNGYDCNELH